jgi:hypothetical protein
LLQNGGNVVFYRNFDPTFLKKMLVNIFLFKISVVMRVLGKKMIKV